MKVVVMAAGMGSRFGGLKQMEPIDEAGNFLLDYSCVDAKEAGFDSVVFIIKHAFEKEFKETIGARVSRIMKVEYAFQEIEDLPHPYTVPEGRVKPWGTAHAIICAKEYLTEPFIIINGDDYYGKDTYKVAYDFLKTISNTKNIYGNVTFKVANTLTEKGSVKRGVLFNDNDGFMTKLIESSVERDNGTIMATPLFEDTPKFEVEEDRSVSMNLFAFSKDIMDYLIPGFINFLDKKGKEMGSEYLIPNVVNELVLSGKVKCKLLTTPSKWYGITYKEDKEKVVQALKDLTDKGLYIKGLYK